MSEPISYAECGCPTYPIEGGMVDVLHYIACEFHNPADCEACLGLPVPRA